MKKILSIISLAFALSFTANAQFLNTTEIVNSDCRIQFLNSNGIKVYELIGENLTWWKQSSGAIIIRDKVTQVTIPATYNGTPALSVLDDSLDAWILSCKDCCSGGGDGGVCLESCTLADNVNIQTQENVLNFIGETHSFSMNSQELLDDEVTFEFNGLKSYNTDSTNVSFLGSIKFDGDSMFTPYQINISGNPFSGGGGSLYIYNSSAFSDQKNIIYYEDGENKSMYQGFTKDGILITEGPLPDGSTLPENTFAIQNQTTGDSITLKSNGNIIHSGAYANTSYVIYTGGDSDTIPDNISEYIYNPATTVSSKQITLPKNPIAGQVLYILAGGTVTSGDVITSFTLNGNGRTIIGEICPKLTVNEMIQLRYIDGGINKWYVLSQCK